MGTQMATAEHRRRVMEDERGFEEGDTLGDADFRKVISHGR